ncbi:MAG: hypothetical protein HQL53_06095 [Magnetococcales bacterium]|nr:hypothetical protein [Magnetococcales bacterium]
MNTELTKDQKTELKKLEREWADVADHDAVMRVSAWSLPNHDEPYDDREFVDRLPELGSSLKGMKDIFGNKA